MTRARTVNLKRTFKELYSAKREPAIVEMPDLTFLAIDGHGDPNGSPDFEAAIQALYSVSYTLKFTLARSPRRLDYKVMPLEGLWWCGKEETFPWERKQDWDWTLMIAQPDEVDQEAFERAREQVCTKRALPAAARLRLERFCEGTAAQVMHLGPYASEGPTIERLHEFVTASGYELRGKHHEIYLGDPRRAAPEKLKTIVRQPVRLPE